MTKYLLRTNPAQSPDEPEDVRLLDWSPGHRAATIQTGQLGPNFFAGWRPTRQGADLLLLGAGVYCADRTAPRRESADAWTRPLELRLPVADPQAWREARWNDTLGFLTGDSWDLDRHSSPRHPLAGVPGVPPARTSLGVDAVCLFSGGLDSLCGAIDLLEAHPDGRFCLLSHHEGGQASTAQQSLYAALASHYGTDRIQLRRLYLRPAPANRWQARPLPPRRENTTRSRSLLFLSTALAVASACGPDVPVYVPENGFIGVNVPLTRARAGSLSTRTTHPHFMELMTTAARKVGVPNAVVNPYRLATKGEMLAQSCNPALLQRLARHSLSCAHPETARYAKRSQGNCGYCFPCLIRRAALAHVGWDTDSRYAWDVLTEGGLLDKRTRRGADLRAVVNGVLADRPDRDLLRNGPLPAGEHTRVLGTWRRGLGEVRAWLADRARGELATILGGRS